MKDDGSNIRKFRQIQMRRTVRYKLAAGIVPDNSWVGAPHPRQPHQTSSIRQAAWALVDTKMEKRVH